MAESGHKLSGINQLFKTTNLKKGQITIVPIGFQISKRILSVVHIKPLSRALHKNFEACS